MFAGEERVKVVAKMGIMLVGDVGKEMRRRWGLLDSQAKEKYETAFTRDKARYAEEMKSYQPSQQFLEMKAKQALVKKEDDMKTGGTENEKYFSFLLSSWMEEVQWGPRRCMKLYVCSGPGVRWVPTRRRK